MKVCPVCGTEYGMEAAFCSRDRSPLRTVGGEELPDLVGQLVGERYQVERRLGEGGMGQVYLARHLLIGRACALKVMRQALSTDPDAVTRFNREATSASRIAHPNVCTVYDFGLTAEGLVYLAMEYVDGQTLRALLDASGPLSVGRAADLLAQCAAGLAAAHELGIVHRDLKPDNIMVLSTRGVETVKLVDFGIAKAMEGPAGDQVTKSGFVVGTPEYMSPEQLSGDPVGPRSDEYALALVFYRMLTGRLPFEASSLQETLSKRLTDPPRPLAESRPAASFPAGLQAIMDRALARRAEERYGSVLEFAEAVHSAVSAGAGPTRKLGLEQRRHLVTPSSRGAKLAVGAVGALVLAGAVWGVLDWSTGRTVAGGEDTAQATPAAGLGTSDTGSRTTPIRGAAPQPGPGRREATPDDTGQLDLGALDSLPARRTAELRRAERQLELSGLSRRRKAAAAEFLGLAALGDRNRDSARILYRLAYRLDQNPRYLETLRQLGDTIQP